VKLQVTFRFFRGYTQVLSSNFAGWAVELNTFVSKYYLQENLFNEKLVRRPSWWKSNRQALCKFVTGFVFVYYFGF